MSESRSVQKRKALQRVEPAPIFVTDNVTFAGLRDLIKQEWDSNISPIELYVERLEKRVEEVRARLEEEAHQYRSPFYTVTNAHDESLSEGERRHIAEVLDAVRVDVTAILGPVPEEKGK